MYMKRKDTWQTTRRGFLRVLAGAAAGGAVATLATPVIRAAGAAATASGGNANGKKAMNFVIILVDDMGWTDLTCFSSKYYETPSIDRLAAGGMKFTNAYAACAVCSPTRAAVMTGRYPARVGVTDWIRARFQGGKIPEAGETVSAYVGGIHNRVLCPRNPLWMELDEVTIAEALKPAGYT